MVIICQMLKLKTSMKLVFICHSQATWLTNTIHCKYFLVIYTNLLNWGKFGIQAHHIHLTSTKRVKKEFLTYDTQSNTVDSIGIDNEIIYFIETILMLPVDDELAYINKKLEQMINNWQLSDVDINKVTLRLSLFGYTKDINSLVNYIKNFIKNKGIKFYDANEVNISNLKIIKNEDNERNEIFKEVRKKINSLPNLDYADKDSILEKTMEIIFK